jgi:hypothetical protein
MDVSTGFKSWASVILLAMQLAAALIAYGRLDGKVEDLQREVQELRADLRVAMLQR